MNLKKKVPVKNKLAYGLGAGGGCIFTQIAAAFLLQYYTDTALIGAGAIATMFFLCRIIDGVTDLAIGGMIDRTQTKLGKARPWLIASAPLMLIGIVLLMNVPMGFDESGRLAYAYITYIFMNCIVFTIYGISNTALLPLMTKDKHESTILVTCSAVGNNAIGLIAGMTITPLVLNLGWKYSSIILGSVAAVLILILGLTNKEIAVEETREDTKIPLSKQLPAVLKNKYFWVLLAIGALTLVLNANAIGAQIFYCNIVIKNPMLMTVLMTAGQLPGIFMILLLPVISKKWSKKHFLQMGAAFTAIGFVITGLSGGNTEEIVIGTVIRSLGISPLITSVVAFVPDVVEYGNWKFGMRSEGLISSAQSIGAKIGIGIGSGLTGWILSWVGYRPGVEPTEAVINAIEFDFTWMGAIFGIAILMVALLLDVEKYAVQYHWANIYYRNTEERILSYENKDEEDEENIIYGN